MSIELDNIASGYSTGKINENFQKVEDWVNLNALWRQGTELGQANQMEAPLDMNGFPILNVRFDENDPGSLITVGEADARYVNTSGDTMGGPLSVQAPTLSSHAARYGQVLQETQERQASDASLQSQIDGETPTLIADRSIISWHPQTITNSVDIPDNVNAFSFGPKVYLADGVAVTVGENSSWTVANGTNASTQEQVEQAVSEIAGITKIAEGEYTLDGNLTFVE